MGILDTVIGNLGIIAVLLVVMSLMAMVITYARNYHKVAPNQVAVISGRRAGEKGYRVVTGGGFFLWPILERIDYLLLNVMSFNVQVQDVPDKMGVLVDVTGVANVKVQSDQGNLPLAIERFLGKTPADIQAVAKENLESNLRAIVGTMTVEDLNQDRNMLQQRVMSEAVSDLGKLGLGVDVLNIQQVTDKKGYIQSLGKARTAQVVRDATIGEATAKQEAAVASAKAHQLSAEAEAKSEQAISEANRAKELVIAENEAQIQAKQARVPLIAAKAAAEEQKTLNIAIVEADEEKVKAETKLQSAVKARNQAKVEATVLVDAKGDADASVLKAEGEQQSAVRIGEAARIRAEKEAAGELARQTAEAQGRTAIAKAVQTEGEAHAAAKKAQLLAEADGTRAQLTAEAEGIRAKGLAEATGLEAKAKALAEISDTGRLLMLLDASPAAIRAVGDAIGSALKPTSDAIGEGLGNVDEIRIIDMGGAGNGNLVKQFTSIPVETVMALVAKADAAGFGPAIRGLMNKAGIQMPTDSKEE